MADENINLLSKSSLLQLVPKIKGTFRRSSWWIVQPYGMRRRRMESKLTKGKVIMSLCFYSSKIWVDLKEH